MRSKRGVTTHKRHHKVLKAAKGFRGGRSKLYKQAREATIHAGADAYRGRKEKKRQTRSLWITRIPDLSGEWRGRVSPIDIMGVSAGLGVEAEITLTIRQTWTKLLIAARTAQSKSYSISGSFIVSEERILSYEYVNEPAVYAPSTMHAHRGTTRLVLEGRNETLKGEYYCGRDRQNIGILTVTRINENRRESKEPETAALTS